MIENEKIGFLWNRKTDAVTDTSRRRQIRNPLQYRGTRIKRNALVCIDGSIFDEKRFRAFATSGNQYQVTSIFLVLWWK